MVGSRKVQSADAQLHPGTWQGLRISLLRGFFKTFHIIVKPTLPILSLGSCFCRPEFSSDKNNSESTFCCCYIFLCEMLFVAGTQLRLIVSVYLRWLAALSLLPEVHNSFSFSENTTACTEAFVICGYITSPFLLL